MNLGLKLSLHRRNRTITLLVTWLLILFSYYSHNFTYGLFGLALLNGYAFYLMGVDKRAAIRKHTRIPENSLFLVAGFGGSLGAALGMMVFRHKTRHTSFLVLFPLFLLIHFIILWLVSSSFWG